MKPTAVELIQRMREMTMRGVQRNTIAKALGVAPSTVTHHCQNIEKPFEHRGRHRNRRFPVRLYRKLEDEEWD